VEWRRRLVAGLLLPLVAASVLIWSASGRKAHIDRVPVAIVNDDTIITGPQPMAAGRSLTAALTHPTTPSKNLKWELTDSHDAHRGLRDGTYYAVLTIPSNFSASILSSGTDKPVQGRLTLDSNAAASTTMPYLSAQVANAAAEAFGQQVTQSYLGKVYDGFNSLAQGNQEAAKNSAQLAGGVGQVADGAAQLDSGATTLAGGLGQLASGSATLAGGAASVHRGADEVDQGVTTLAHELRRLSAGQADLAAATARLAREDGVLAGRSRALATGAHGVHAAARVVAGGARLVTAEVARLARECASAGADAVFCLRLARAAVHTGAVATGAGRVDTATGRVSEASARLAAGVSRSAHALSAAGARLSHGASTLESGAGSLARGAAQVDSGAAGLASGSGNAADAGTTLASGSDTLAASARQASTGAHQLSSGLSSAAAQSPTYTAAQQQALTPVVSQPVAMTTHVQHGGHGNGWLVALVVAVVLWLAALVAALTRDLSGISRNATAPLASRRMALGELVPLLGLAVLHAVAVILAVVVFHPSTAALGPLALLALLGAASFALLALAFRLLLGRAGVTLFVLFLILQVAASGNVIPLETAPGVLRTLNGLMPLTAFVNGASQLVSGGHVASYVAVVAVLVAWALVGWAALLAAVKRRRAADPLPPASLTLAPT
jgi:putative membrane protein